MPFSIRIPGRPEVFAAGKLICIGRNYAAHASEMKSAVPSVPMLFLKPASSIVSTGGEIVLPAMSNDVHHEVELVVLIGLGGKDIQLSESSRHVAGYAVGLDMTARDVQSVAKAKGHPWTVSKGFDTFAPLGDFVPGSAVPNPQALDITLRVNGEIRQSGNTADMLFPVDELIAYCSSIMTLEAGDLIFTGTPEGVAAVSAGDVLEASVDGLPTLEVSVSR